VNSPTGGPELAQIVTVRDIGEEAQIARLELADQARAIVDRMAAALESVGQAMRSLRGTPSAENVKAAREAMATVRATTTGHLDHEEAGLEPFYLEHAHTPEMKAMGRAFGREYKPPEAGTYFAWLQDARQADAHSGCPQP